MAALITAEQLRVRADAEKADGDKMVATLLNDAADEIDQLNAALDRDDEVMRHRIGKALRREREACAMLAEEINNQPLADAIRARNTP